MLWSIFREFSLVPKSFDVIALLANRAFFGEIPCSSWNGYEVYFDFESSKEGSGTSGEPDVVKSSDDCLILLLRSSAVNVDPDFFFWSFLYSPIGLG